VWVEDKLARQTALFAARPELGMVYAAVWVVDRALAPIRCMEAPPADVALRNTLLLELPVVAVSMTAVVRRDLALDVGGFDPSLSTSADTDFACRVALRAPVAAVHAPLALYRQHECQMHLDARAMGRDMVRIYRMVFADAGLPAEVARLRRRAYANLETTLGLASFSGGERLLGIRHLATALVWHPHRTVHLLGRLAVERLADTAGRRPPAEP
jgi:hypothetical protein